MMNDIFSNAPGRGNMAAVVSLRARDRQGPNLVLQALFYPNTHLSLDSRSYFQFGEGYLLSREDREFDPRRDEVEAYAHKLIEAGVAVTAIRALGTIHGFVTLNALANTPAARAAVALANESLRKAFSKRRTHENAA